MHAADDQGVTTDALQRNLMARLQRSESEGDMRIDTSQFDGCAASHDGVINPNNNAGPMLGFVPKSIEIGSESDVSHSKHTDGSKKKGMKGFLQRFKGKGLKKKSEEKQGQVFVTVEANDSDIESNSDISVSSFASDAST